MQASPPASGAASRPAVVFATNSSPYKHHRNHRRAKTPCGCRRDARTTLISFARELAKCCPKVKPILLTQHDEPQYVSAALSAGVKGYVLKSQISAELIHAIQQVLRGQVYLSDKVKDAIVNRLGGNFPEGEITPLIDQLSDRELQIFQMIGDGFNGWIIPHQSRRNAQIEMFAESHSQFGRQQRVEPLISKRLPGIDLRHVALYETGNDSANLVLEKQLTVVKGDGLQQYL